MRDNKGIIICLIIVVLILLGGSIYLFFQNGDLKNEIKELKSNKTQEVEKKEEEKQPEEKKEEVKEQEVDVDDYIDLYNSVISTSGYSTGSYYKYFIVPKFEVLKDLNSQDAYGIIMAAYFKENKSKLSAGSIINASELDRYATKMFGKEYKLTHKEYPVCPLITYDSTKKVYEVENLGCGLEGVPYYVSTPVKAIKNDKELDIFVKVLFVCETNNENEIPYCKKYLGKEEIKGLDREENGLPTDEAIKDNGVLFKLVFNYEDGNYILVSVNKEDK